MPCTRCGTTPGSLDLPDNAITNLSPLLAASFANRFGVDLQQNRLTCARSDAFTRLPMSLPSSLNFPLCCAAIVLLGGCHSRAAAPVASTSRVEAAASVTASSTAVTATAPVAAPSSPVAPAVVVSSPASTAPSAPSAAVGTAGALPGRLGHFFAGYTEGSDFEFMRADCRPTLPAFVTLRNVSVDEVIRNATSFFRNKRRISYRPDAPHARSAPHADGQLVSLPVTMSWSYPAPKEWGPPWTTWDDVPLIVREVTVNTEIELDSEGRIARYVERSVEQPLLRVTGDENCEGGSDILADGPAIDPWLVLKPGQLVRDLGETVVISINPKGANTARRVRTQTGDGWTLNSVSFAVENPAGGTSAGASDCLTRVVAKAATR
jgi:hypothetical protein